MAKRGEQKAKKNKKGKPTLKVVTPEGLKKATGGDTYLHSPPGSNPSPPPPPAPPPPKVVS